MEILKELAVGFGKFVVEINDHGVCVRREDRSIILDASTLATDGMLSFATKDFTVRHRKRYEQDGKTLMYDFYELKHIKPKREPC